VKLTPEQIEWTKRMIQYHTYHERNTNYLEDMKQSIWLRIVAAPEYDSTKNTVWQSWITTYILYGKKGFLLKNSKIKEETGVEKLLLRHYTLPSSDAGLTVKKVWPRVRKNCKPYFLALAAGQTMKSLAVKEGTHKTVFWNKVTAERKRLKKQFK
jgi:hypothetical protein